MQIAVSPLLTLVHRGNKPCRCVNVTHGKTGEEEGFDIAQNRSIFARYLSKLDRGLSISRSN